MTSRREFFGLLAAAPLVGPAVVREMAAATSAPKYAAGSFADVLAKYRGHLSRPLRFKDWPTGEGFPVRFETIARLDGLPMSFAVVEEETPNRLYGAQINADGEAI